MSGLENVIVGYRQGDPRIAQLWEEHGRRALPHRPCINCGAVCWYVESGVSTIRTRDPQTVCEDCWSRDDVKQAIYREL